MRTLARVTMWTDEVATNRKQVHLINSLWSADSGSEIRTLRLYELLSRNANVTLWSQYEVAAEIARGHRVSVIAPKRLRFPKSGIFVFIGAYFSYGRWPMLSRPERIIVLYNTHDEDLLRRNLRRLRWPHLPAVDMLYASHELAEAIGARGVVEISPIDIERFSPRSPATQHEVRPFTVGRLTRDRPEKHFLNDAGLYDELTDRDTRVRLMGAMSVRERLRPGSTVELLPASAEEAGAFLRSLDCFYYRTHEGWPEPYGRVIFEALACGLPVVAHRAGRYARYITHGVNGFLFDEQSEALTLIAQLRAEPALRDRIGLEARRLVEQLYGHRYEADLTKYYLG